MSCNTRIITTKRKKIVVFSSIGSGIAITSYLAFTTTNNPAIAATIPALLSLVACPAMCAVMGGAFWFINRFSKNRNNKNQIVASKEEGKSCCGEVVFQNQIESKKESINPQVAENKHKEDIAIALPSSLSPPPSKHKKEKQKIKHQN